MKCGLCGRQLDDPADPVGSVDCGGDCRRCMAGVGDGDEIRNMGWTVDGDGVIVDSDDEQGLLLAALTVLEATPGADERDIDWMRIAQGDHDDPEIGCMAEPGTECIALRRARQILGREDS